MKIVEAREHALLWQERDVAAKEEELIEREEVLKAKERDYNILCKDMEAECFRFRKEYRFRHKVLVSFIFVAYLSPFRIVVILRIRTLTSGITPTQSFVEVLTSMTAIWYVVVVVGLCCFLIL